MGVEEELSISKVIREALLLSETLGAAKTVDVLRNMRTVNDFNMELREHIIKCVLNNYNIKWVHLIAKENRTYEAERMDALTIISLMLSKYCGYSYLEIAKTLKKEGKQNIVYYVNRSKKLSSKNPSDIKLRNDLVKIEAEINIFIENYPI